LPADPAPLSCRHARETRENLEGAVLYHLEFTVGYGADMSQQDLFDIWQEEAGVAIGAKEAGVVVDLWKVVGERRVIVIIDIDSPNTLDQILFDLPIMKRMGQYVTIKTTPLRRYEDFAEDVKARLKS
jgi:muconolactone D-isomerase